MKTMSSKWATLVLTVSLLTSLLNVAIFVRLSFNPARPVNVEGVLAKDWLKDPQFKKAVESIADDVVEGKDYLDQAGVESVIGNCVVQVNAGTPCGAGTFFRAWLLPGVFRCDRGD
jgi:hypothetical protein